jgi:hypothetical protein
VAVLEVIFGEPAREELPDEADEEEDGCFPAS